VLSGTGLCHGPIPRPEASHRVDESPSAIKRDNTPLLQGSSVCTSIMRPTITFVVYVDTVNITTVYTYVDVCRYCITIVYVDTVSITIVYVDTVNITIVLAGRFSYTNIFFTCDQRTCLQKRVWPFAIKRLDGPNMGT
jgi:hypothetical protein